MSMGGVDFRVVKQQKPCAGSTAGKASFTLAKGPRTLPLSENIGHLAGNVCIQIKASSKYYPIT